MYSEPGRGKTISHFNESFNENPKNKFHKKQHT